MKEKQYKPEDLIEGQLPFDNRPKNVPLVLFEAHKALENLRTRIEARKKKS